MASIKVIKTDVQSRSVSNEERKIIFDNMSKKSSIDKYHFDIFAEEERKLIELENASVKPDIFNILIRNIMSHPFITPICKTQFQIHKTKMVYVDFEGTDEDGDGEDEDLPKSSVDMDIITGGRVPQKSKDSQPSLAELAQAAKNKGSIDHIFRHPIQVNRIKRVVAYVDSLEFDDYYIMDNTTTFDVCGYILKSHTVPTDFGTWVGHNYISQIQRGIYDYPALGSNTDYSTPLRIDEQVVIFQTLLGTDSEKYLSIVQSHLIQLFDKLNMIDSYYRSNNPVMNFNQEIVFYSNGQNKKSEIQSNLRHILYREIGKPNKTISPKKIDPLLLKLVQKISFIHKIATYSEIQILFDFLNLGIFYIWEHVSINGFDKELDDILAELQKRKNMEDVEKQELMLKYEKYAENMDHLSLIEKRLDKERINQLDIGKDIVSQLDEKEKRILKSEIARRDKSKIKNSCAHTALLESIKNVRSESERKQLLKELGKFNSGKEIDGFFQCKECKNNLICSHSLDELKMLVDKTSIKESREKLLKYAADFSQENHMYCKYCGEEYLEEIGEEENDFLNELNHNSRTHGFSNDIDELQSIIWGEISYLVYQRLYYKNIHNVKNIIKFITENIYDFIYEIEKRLNKSQTNTLESVQERVRLYSAIYGVASLISIVKRNHNKIWFSTKIADKKSDKLEDLFKQAMIIIIDSKNISISKFKISNGNLLAILKKAYSELSEKRWVEITPKHDLLELLESEPNFDYLYKVLSLSFLMRDKLPPQKTDIDKLFTKSLNELKGAKGLFEFFKFPKLTTELKLPITSQNIDNAMDHYWKVSFEEWFNNHILNKKVLEDVYNKSFNENRIEFDHEFKKLENKISEYHKTSTSHLFCQTILKDTRQYSFQDVNLAHIYDSEGNKHNWNIYVYSYQKKTVELRSKDVVDIISDKHKIKFNEFKKYDFIDYRCSDCKKYKSKIVIRNLEGILDEIDSIENFYRYYEFRCPKQFIHEWTDDICRYCMVTRDQIKNHNKTYYNKYKNTVSGNNYVLQFPTYTKAPASKKWKFNINIITELSKLTGVKFNILTNLGFTEGYEYSSIVDSSANPSLRKTASKSRMNRLNGYNNVILREYQLLRNRSILRQVPKPIKDLIKKYEFKHEDLPVIYESYLDNYENMRVNTAHCTNFALESLASNLIMLLKSKMEVVKEFGKYIFEKIIQTDRIHSKPSEMNLGIVWDDVDLYDSDDDVDDAPEQDYDYEEDENEDNEFHREY